MSIGKLIVRVLCMTILRHVRDEFYSHNGDIAALLGSNLNGSNLHIVYCMLNTESALYLGCAVGVDERIAREDCDILVTCKGKWVCKLRNKTLGNVAVVITCN